MTEFKVGDKVIINLSETDAKRWGIPRGTPGLVTDDYSTLPHYTNAQARWGVSLTSETGNTMYLGFFDAELELAKPSINVGDFVKHSNQGWTGIVDGFDVNDNIVFMRDGNVARLENLEVVNTGSVGNLNYDELLDIISKVRTNVRWKSHEMAEAIIKAASDKAS